MKFERTNVSGLDNAIYGMRNPMNSWTKMDSRLIDPSTGTYAVGDNDLKLIHTLVKSGPEHAKFLRMIHAQVQISAPLYWWKEMDQYKVGTTTNSCSTMHKLLKTPITQECFEEPIFEPTRQHLENLRQEALNLQGKQLDQWRVKWKKLIQELPESWVQPRMWDADYQTIRNICHQRKGHKLSEWFEFITWARTLPLAEDTIFYEGK